MQFLIVLFILAFHAVAQNTTTLEVLTTTYALSPQQSCLSTCKVTDVDCRAACIGAAHPNQSQLSLQNACAMKCVQGDGSVSQTNTYNQCLAACQASYQPITQTTAAAGVSTSVITSRASTTGAGLAVAGTSTSSSRSESRAATASAAAQTISKAAGATAGPFVGGFALFLAALAF